MMLLIDVFRYLNRRADKRGVFLENFVDHSHHHKSPGFEPVVSIIVPTRDKVELLRACVNSIFELTTYKNYEVVIVDNGSKEAQTLEYLSELRSHGVRVLQYPHKFNYSAICNFAAGETASEFLCFLNNDTEVIEPKWLSLLVEHAVQKDAGLVGARLTYADESIQHLGIVRGYKGIAGHICDERILTPEKVTAKCFEVTAVTFACALVSRSDYLRLGGLDEEFKVGLNDVDFGLRVLSDKKVNILCGDVKLVHLESQSRDSMRSMRGAFRAAIEVLYFLKKHGAKKDDYFSTRA